MKRLILPLLSFLILLSSADARFWTNKDGKSFEGELVEVRGNAVTIRRTRDRIKFTVNAADLSQGDQEYLKELEEKKKAEEKAKVEASASKNKPKSPKDKLPTSEKQFAKWIVGTEWATRQGDLDGGASGAIGVRRFYPDGVMIYQYGTSKWTKGAADESQSKYTITDVDTIQLTARYKFTLKFHTNFKSFEGRSKITKNSVKGELMGRFNIKE